MLPSCTLTMLSLTTSSSNWNSRTHSTLCGGTRCWKQFVSLLLIYIPLSTQPVLCRLNLAVSGRDSAEWTPGPLAFLHHPSSPGAVVEIGLQSVLFRWWHFGTVATTTLCSASAVSVYDPVYSTATKPCWRSLATNLFHANCHTEMWKSPKQQEGLQYLCHCNSYITSPW